MQITVLDVEATTRLATALASALRAGDVIVLEGTLGAGKTTFVGMVAHALGLDEEEPVTSPTFAIVHELETNPPLVHADLYRLSSDADVDAIGLSEQLGGQRVAFIEWGERFTVSLGQIDVLLRIFAAIDDSRSFVFEPRSARGHAICEAVSRAVPG